MRECLYLGKIQLKDKRLRPMVDSNFSSKVTNCDSLHTSAGIDRSSIIVIFLGVNRRQECIPVGCIPPVAVTVHGGAGGSASVHAGIHLPQCRPGDPQVWASRPPLVWAWKPPTDLQGMPGYHLQGMLGYPPPLWTE